MSNSDYELKIVRLRVDGEEVGYGIKLLPRKGLKDYRAVIFYEAEDSVSLFEIYEDDLSKKKEKRFFKKHNVWINKGCLGHGGFFPSDSLEHRAFELLYGCMLENERLETRHDFS